MWTSIKNLTPLVADRLNLKKQMNKEEVCFLWLKLVTSLFGKKSTDRFKPLYLKNKTLFIQCPNSSWANELQMRHLELLEKLNANSQKKKVERINFVF